MKIIPLFKCRNMQEAINFYTQILDFKPKHAHDTAHAVVVDLVCGDCELQLTTLESESLYGSVLNVHVEDVDERFMFYLGRGLDVSDKVNSPVHQCPIDQSWGFREFYITDPSGNTLRFRQPYVVVEVEDKA